MRTDRWHLEVVQRNLIENAVTYSPPGSTIEIAAGHSRSRVFLSVRNPAPDLQPPDLERLCERFWRGSESRSDRDRSGLGLALVRHIMEAHGGEVQVESAPGKGSSFTLVLPLDRDKA